MDLSYSDFKIIRQFYVDVLFYEYCPESMQTVSLVEKILGQLSYIHCINTSMNFAVDEYLDAYYQACAFIEEVFDTGVVFNMEGINYKWDYSNILETLKENARSGAVKEYFGL
jgi:hypothetical protein